ncbi:MAG: DUF6544 family protein [Anaerolineaceae bacterium]
MNSALSFLLTILGVLVAAGLLFWLGFRVKPRVKRPWVEAAEDAAQPDLPAGLPEPWQRYLNECGLKTVPYSLVGWGRGKIVANKNLKTGPLWTPLRWHLMAQPEVGFVSKTEITWFGYPLLRGGDELLPNRARFSMGGNVLENENIRRSEETMFWLYQIWMAPALLAADTRVRWETVDGQTVKMFAPVGAEDGVFTLRFDPTTGGLVRVETLRAASRDGANLPFSVRFSGTCEISGVGTLPEEMGAAWEDEEYTVYNLSGVRYDGEVGEEVRQGLNDGSILAKASPDANEEEEEETEEQEATESEEEADETGVTESAEK